MKHISMAALAAGALLCAVTSCGDSTGAVPAGTTLQGRLDSELASAKTFADSLTAVNGTFIGGFFNTQLNSPNLPKPLNRSEFIRGMRDALRCDTADMSYIYGFNSGATALQSYVDMTKSEQISREAFVNAIVAALRVDSVSQEELMAVRGEYERYGQLAAERARQKAIDEAVNSEAGQANIKAAEEYAARLAAAEDFSAAASGVYVRVLTPGEGDNLAPQERVNVVYTLSHLDGTEVNSVTTPRPMYVASPSQPVLRGLLPMMKMGESAEFFVPAEQAYGELGNESAGVGPCEALMVKVTVSPVE